MKVQKITLIELFVLFSVCLIPLLWFKEGYFYANGDDFPLFLNPHLTLTTGTSLWSTNYLGSATPMPAYLIYQSLGAFLSYLGLATGSIQTILLISLFIVAGFSMFYLAKKIYPESKVSAFIAGFFYILNFFFLINLRNIGFRWTYAFLPLILALFFNIMTATFHEDKKNTHKNIIYFALVSVVAFSFASINPANIALFLIGLSVLAIYFLQKFKTRTKTFFVSLAKLLGATFPANLWWLIPILNSFIFSGQTLNTQVSINSWSWTHSRASFLNLFWLNGSWNWSPEYFPYFNSYTNNILTFFVFVPFLIAGLALLFKSNKSRFNAYLMIVIAIFLFLATGVHYTGTYLDPLSRLNLFLYNYIPFMSIFREPVSKLTIIMLPFLALLVGYGSEKISDLKMNKIRIPFPKFFVTLLLTIILLVSVYPILISKMETSTSQLNYSSQVRVPDYWYQATTWINNQPGYWKVLLTPINDFYQMPYSWGYYGTDQLLERFFEKPIVSTSPLDGYLTNANTSDSLTQIRKAVNFNRTYEFRTLLDLFAIKYIVQRNDVTTDMVGRNLMSPSEMKGFFNSLPYLKLEKTFGELDIYQYIDAKPSIYTILPSTFKQTDIYIEKHQSLNKTWDFSKTNAVEEWKNSTLFLQSQATCLVNQQDNQLKVEMWNSTSSWITVSSPILNAENESSYIISGTFSARKDSQINITISEYSENMELLKNTTFAQTSLGSFDDYIITGYRFEPKNQLTKFFQIQFWNYFKTNETNQSTLLLKNINILGTVSTLNITGSSNLYTESPVVLQINNETPTRLVAKINTNQPFILATSQELDKFWVVYINGQRVQSVPLYLGLEGFLINETGQLTVTLEYEPQTWFNYSIIISLSTILLLCLSLFYQNRANFSLLTKWIKKNRKIVK